MAEQTTADDAELLRHHEGSRKSSTASAGPTESKSNSRRSSRRLSRQASMERHSMDERQEPRRSRKFDKRRSCPDYFGVKSYLHNFYDTAFFKDPSIYEEDDYRFLLNPTRRRRRCRPVWWKVSTWIGVNLMIFGLVGILVGYLVPRKPIIIDTDSDHQIVVVDKEADPHNTMLDMCKVIGLVLFCLGGITLALALIFPSFFYQYCNEERDEDTLVSVRYSDDPHRPPLSPIEMTIPASAKLSNVQPERNGAESLITKDGMVNVRD